MRTRGHPRFGSGGWAAPRLALLLLACAASAAGAQGASVLTGHVIAAKDGKRLGNALVTLDSLALRARTDSTGTFLVAAIPAGSHAVRVRRDGYALLDTILAFTGRDTVTASFALDDAADTIDPVALKMVDFERRRAKGLGWFITRDDLAASYDRELSEVLRRRVPGVVLLRGRTGGVAVASSRGIGSQSQESSGDGFPPACYVQVFVDAVRVFASGQQQPPPDIDSWRTSDIEGVEFYPALQDTPPEFTGLGAMCGTIALWLRVQ